MPPASRIAGVACLLALVVVGPASAAAQTQAVGRTVVLTVDGTTLGDWTQPGLPGFARLLADGSVALLSTRTGAGKDAPYDVARRAAFASVGAGRRLSSSAPPAGTRLGDVLRAAGGRTTLVSTGPPVSQPPAFAAGLGASVAAVRARVDPSFPGGARSDSASLAAAALAALLRADVVFVDIGDTALVERAVGGDESRDDWARRALQRADRVLAAVRAALQPRDLLIVASTVPPAGRLSQNLHLGAIAAVGPGTAGGRLTSATTRREGVASIIDLAPTLLARHGAGTPAHVDGRAIETRAAEDGIADLLGLERDLLHSATARFRLTRLMLIGGMVLVGLALVTVLAGRGGPPRRTRFPRGWRDTLATALIAVGALPVAFLLEPLLPTDTNWSAIPASIALAAGAALAARAALGRRLALLAVFTATAALTLGDLALGSPLSSRSVLGFQIAGGGRFYGVDEGMMGVIVGSLLLAAAIALDEARERAVVVPAVAVAFALAVFLLGAPSFGSKFGAPFTAIPAFGVLAARAGGRRFDRVTLLAIAIATVLTSGAFAAADALRDPETQSHIGRAVAGAGESTSLIVRKISAFVRITFSTIWLPAFAVFAASVGLLAWRRTMLVGRGLWGMPHLRAALWGILLGSAIALVANDTGIITAAPMAMLGAVTVFVVLLAPD